MATRFYVGAEFVGTGITGGSASEAMTGFVDLDFTTNTVGSYQIGTFTSSPAPGDPTPHYGNLTDEGGGNYNISLHYGAGNLDTHLDLSFTTQSPTSFTSGSTGLRLKGAPVGGETLTASTIATDGDDNLTGGAGDDAALLGPGNDSYSAGDGNNLVRGAEGNDVVTSGAGADTLFGGQGNDQLAAGAGNDIIYGNFDGDTLNGDDGNDTIFGGHENDVLFGGAGDDSLIGGRDDDTMTGGAGADTYSLWAYGINSGNDLILGFSQTEGDKIDFAGQTYTMGDDGNGGTLLTLSGGGTADLAGVAMAAIDRTTLAA